MIRRLIPGLAILATTFVLVGCGSKEKGPELAPVSGVIKADGQPLPKAIVRFEPTAAEIGRGSTGVTDEQGRYELTYTVDQKGAVVGPHKVTISLLDEKEHETLPAKFNANSDLTAEVPAGGKTFDFEVTRK